jgi:outer membrane protein assembly factor BamB
VTAPPAARGIEQALAQPEWPAFRGTDRAARSRGPEVGTDWSARPPRQLWRIPVGPAWSSLAVAGSFLFTQEQRGPMEAVVWYEAETGREVWSQQVEARFDEPLGGPGPRATPTLAGGGLFATGATGMFLRLNPETEVVVWQDVESSGSRR